ncbi:hypothetical protein DFR29_11022 [Tahibacter aquaticus]|uniref:Lipoprotein n=1 Tax=Tahibacter aquaticus TaxID=520092 RepID=A0A4R6YTL3_9GAMM|nr:hypothetical protein [Tahibacter aquaticus]TDR41540.1 hypothetical protein DFR29_11022 [Tahibacter aquaticus]
MNPRRRLPLLLALLPLLHACGGSPDSLARDVQAAFEKGDMDAVLALAKIDGAPADLHFFLLDQVRECGTADVVCTAAAGPLDDGFKKQQAGMAEQGMEVAAAPEGLVVLQAKDADGKGHGKLQMPFAKVDGNYRLIAQRYTPAKLAELRATTNQQLLEKMLAGGIYDSKAQERRTDWKDGATPLPADGGEPGQALVRSSAALYAAVQANDPDAAVKSGNGFAKMVLADKDYDGKPVALEVRKAKMRTQSMRFLHDVKVSAGWQRDNDAIVLVDAKDGLGWVSRGAVFLMKDEDGWNIAGKQMVSYP